MELNSTCSSPACSRQNKEPKLGGQNLVFFELFAKITLFDSDKQAVMLTCKSWHYLAANTSRMWSAYSIKTSEMAEVATYKRHQKYLKQFRFFIKKFELNGGDPFKVFFVKTRIGPFGPRPTNRLEVL